MISSKVLESIDVPAVGAGGILVGGIAAVVGAVVETGTAVLVGAGAEVDVGAAVGAEVGAVVGTRVGAVVGTGDEIGEVGGVASGLLACPRVAMG